MKPVIANASSSASATNNGEGNSAGASASSNGTNIPIYYEYGSSPHHQPHYYNTDGNSGSYGSPRQHQQHYSQQPPQHNPAHNQQGFGFEPDIDMDMDMDMFPRSRMGRMHHDPFSSFGNSHFDFPQFGTLGRRRAANDHHMGDDRDFFNRLPTEFRQYIPEGFGHRRTGTGTVPTHHQVPTGGQGPYYQSYAPPSGTQNYTTIPQSPSKTLCDAAIQTDDPRERSEVDSASNVSMQTDNLNQHGLRNTMDMGIKSAAENENHGPRSHSAPPPEQQQQYQQQMSANNNRPTPPPQSGRPSFGTQTSHSNQTAQHVPIQKSYYPPQQQSHPQQKQATPPPPQTPGGSYIRTIPIFVEGRSEPIINSHKDIPNQHGNNVSANATASSRAGPNNQPQQHYTQQQQQQQPQYNQQHYNQPQQQQQRPAPLNTHQPQQTQDVGPTGLPPQTPHTLDSINKIQDIQRDVLDLMAKVENFTGKRQDKEYVYLDEMLTRNLLKLDTIDTNGKDSIRLARKEAIKCIQASINVLEAKAEENAKRMEANVQNQVARQASTETLVDNSTKDTDVAATETPVEPVDATKLQEPIPLPPPEGMQVDDRQVTADRATDTQQEQAQLKEGSPATATNNETETK